VEATAAAASAVRRKRRRLSSGFGIFIAGESYFVYGGFIGPPKTGRVVRTVGELPYDKSGFLPFNNKKVKIFAGAGRSAWMRPRRHPCAGKPCRKR
jgi:hypothetical protein